MTCEEIRELLEFHDLGLLEPDERRAVSEHLATGCETCARSLATARELNALVLTATDLPEPPASLRDRVLNTLSGSRRPQRSWMAWTGYAIAASLAVVGVWLGASLSQEERDLADARAALKQATISEQNLQQAIQLLRDPVTQLTAAGTGPAGVYYLNQKRGVLLIANNMEQLQPGRTYQMWILPKDQAPRPAGLFQPLGDGSAIHLFPSLVDLATVTAVAVTDEPASGSSAPTTTPFLVAKVGE